MQGSARAGPAGREKPAKASAIEEGPTGKTAGPEAPKSGWEGRGSGIERRSTASFFKISEQTLWSLRGTES